MILLKLIKESLLFALDAIRVNKLRTVLSLLGITIGIFAIISVFTVIDAMEKGIKDSIASLGDNVIFVQKWPWAFDADYPWWKYLNRPVPKLNEKDLLKKQSLTANEAVFMATDSRTVKFKGNNIENVTTLMVSENYQLVRDFEIAKGRYFSEFEEHNGNPVVVIGHTIASSLFGDVDPLGKDVKIYGRNVQVIGVFKREGENSFGNSNDKIVVLPVKYARGIVDVNSERYGPLIMVKAKPNVSNLEMKDELRGIMRAIRKLHPREEINFALNESSLISKGVEPIFSALGLAGWVIGGFSILVGGFGIANIMFVSVKERTTIIGIQKALGAKQYFILLQFLFEAIILCLIGGLAGLFIILLITWIISNASPMELTLTQYNIVKGIVISVSIGLISGFLPALAASRLNPVVAIRAN